MDPSARPQPTPAGRQPAAPPDAETTADRGSTSPLERLASEMNVLASEGGMVAPELARRALILRLARDVAHAGERQEAPLATYLVGRYVERRGAAGVSEDGALEEAAEMVARVLET